MNVFLQQQFNTRKKKKNVSEFFTLYYQSGVNKKKKEIPMIYLKLIVEINMYHICMHALLLISLLSSTNTVYNVPVITPLTSSPNKFREVFWTEVKSNVDWGLMSPDHGTRPQATTGMGTTYVRRKPASLVSTPRKDLKHLRAPPF